MKTLLLLGSGELGREVTISAKRLGCRVIAVDRYPNAPAMQMADHFEVIDMLNGRELKKICRCHKPDFIVPEVEAIRTEALLELEDEGFCVIPTARAAHLTMNRDAIRDIAAKELKLRTARYAYAATLEELQEAVSSIGYPCVVKPVMSSSGKGQSVLRKANEVQKSWHFAVQNMRGDKPRVIVEEFIDFDFEITLLTVKQWNGPTRFITPIGHRQERGDYQESWMPARMTPSQLSQAQRMAGKVTDHLGGAGLFGVEFFVAKNEVIFSELSPRPHDTGLVTLISQDLSEFDLHVRAILGLPIPQITYYGPSASAVILAGKNASRVTYAGVDLALKASQTEVRLFGKTEPRPYRRMGVALARAQNPTQARKKATQAASRIKLQYHRK